jgi:hypothetical protein
MFRLSLKYILTVNGNYILEAAAIENEIEIFFRYWNNVTIHIVHNCFDSDSVENVFFLPLGLGW